MTSLDKAFIKAFSQQANTSAPAKLRPTTAHADGNTATAVAERIRQAILRALPEEEVEGTREPREAVVH